MAAPQGGPSSLRSLLRRTRGFIRRRWGCRERVAVFKSPGGLSPDADDCASGVRFFVAGAVFAHARAIRLGIDGVWGFILIENTALAPTARQDGLRTPRPDLARTMTPARSAHLAKATRFSRRRGAAGGAVAVVGAFGAFLAASSAAGFSVASLLVGAGG